MRAVCDGAARSVNPARPRKRESIIVVEVARLAGAVRHALRTMAGTVVRSDPSGPETPSCPYTRESSTVMDLAMRARAVRHALRTMARTVVRSDPSGPETPSCPSERESSAVTDLALLARAVRGALRRTVRTVVRSCVVAPAVVLSAAAAPEGAGPEQGPITETDKREATSVTPQVPETQELTARATYNAGLEKLRAGDHEAAAEAFLDARDRAGPDPELRYRAAFNLGLALAAGAGDPADDGESAEIRRQAIAALRRSAAWFGDAVRLAPPGDDDARVNLELVSRRILQIADSLRDTDRLQERLDRLIDDQRDVRDQVRRLLAEVQAEGAATEPLDFKDAYHGLASRERALAAEVGDGIDLAAEERLFIEQTAEDQRTQEQRLRAWQLTAAGRYLERARQSLGEARRRLRRLEGEPGHRRAEAALADLKRAREQLMDPVTVLGAVARDEAELIVHTDALAAFARGALDPDHPPPGWLTSRHLLERQRNAEDRTGEVLARFEAAVSEVEVESETAAGLDPEPGSALADEPTTEPGADTAPDSVPDSAGETPETQRVLRAAARAAPVLAGAMDGMREAVLALEAEDAAAAAAAQRLTLDGLRRAIEEFAGVKQLIELTHGDQQGIVGLLSPETGEQDRLSAAERGQAVLALAAANERRLGKLQALLEEEAVGAAAQAAAAAAPGGQAAEGSPHTAQEGTQATDATGDRTQATRESGEVAPAPDAAGDTGPATTAAEARQAVERRYEHAETLRAQAADGLRTLRSELDRMAAGDTGKIGGLGGADRVGESGELVNASGAGESGELVDAGGAGESGELTDAGGAGESGELVNAGGAGESGELVNAGGAGESGELTDAGGAGESGELTDAGGAGESDELVEADRVGEDGGARARSAAQATLAALDELGRLFFSIVEHLQALHADQADTRDRTAALQVERAVDIKTLEANLGLVSERQQRHAQLAGALAAALAEQADASTGALDATGAAPPDPDIGPETGKGFAEAADEVRKAGGRMTEAGARLAESAQRSASPILEPVLEDQMAAVEHLENALRALANAEDTGADRDRQQQQQAGQAQAAQEPGDQPMSRRQALKRLQAIRDRDAERQRQRQAATPAREPVEKDW